MNEIAISTKGLMKDYHLYDSPWKRLKEAFFKVKSHHVFRALSPVDIFIRKGESIGIIGENGAGKSTFLKLISGVLEPTAGIIEINGKVSSILELGTGFHPDFTGRENVRLNATLYGLLPQEIDKRMDAIESFADIGEFFDMPVKIYSSGMYVRLAFSLSVHVNADILVIDEALAVGDGAYMKKCIDKIWEMKKNGTTILFCSHSLYTVVTFCERTMWIRKGNIEAIGETKEVVSRYEEYLREKENVENEYETVLIKNADLNVAKIKGIGLMADGQKVEGEMLHSSDLEVIIDFEIFEDKDIGVGFAVDRNDGLCCYADSMVKQKLKPFKGPGCYSLSIFFPNFSLLNGPYKFVVFLLDETGICIFDRTESQIFKVNTSEKEWGICRLPHEWRR